MKQKTNLTTTEKLIILLLIVSFFSLIQTCSIKSTVKTIKKENAIQTKKIKELDSILATHPSTSDVKLLLLEQNSILIQDNNTKIENDKKLNDMLTTVNQNVNKINKKINE